ncbi:MAG: beta strand repeat-containing protein [Steroidobacterales bacterium]
MGTTVNGDPAPFAVTTSVLPAAQAGSPYSVTLQASGGTGPYAWSLIAGTLPQGLLLNTGTGVISGTPVITAPGTVTLTFSATDSGNPAQSIPVTVSLTITPAKLRVLTTSLPSGSAGAPYSATLSAAGGVGAYTWTLTSGTLPAGLTLNSTTGAITGNPAPASGDQLTFQVSDSESPAQTSSVTVALNITLAGGGLSITTAALPSGQVGVPYSVTLTASGGTMPYTWALTNGVLPAGLSLDPASGTIRGTPTAAVSGAALTFKVTDSGTFVQSNSATFSLTIKPATLRIASTSLPGGQVGVRYNATLAATGGTTPYTWSLTNGRLPAGLSLDAVTGAITGTPTVVVSGTSLTFSITDSGTPAQGATVVMMLTIAPATLIVTTTSLPKGQVGVPYSVTLNATGGITPYKWSLASGTLPAGLALNPVTGTIAGTPSAVVSALPLTFRVTDSAAPAQSAVAAVTLTIAPQTLVITTTSLPGGQLGVAYSTSLVATGGTGSDTWTLTSGTLPAGLVLNATNGAISGTPTAAVSKASLTFKVTDSGIPAQNASATLTLTIAPATLQITTTTLPNGQVGAAYSAPLIATGGTTAYTWSLASGTLPAGLSLDPATGIVSGTPSAAASGTSLTFRVTDSEVPAQSATASMTITITAAMLKITTTSLPGGQVGKSYFTTLSATGGTTPYTWSLPIGTLPAGLSLDPVKGVISGTPTATTSATSLTFRVVDTGAPAQTATATLTLTIAPAALVITTSSLPNGRVGASYTTTLAAAGGTGAYTWLLTSGTLPAGLTFSAGTISGTPNATASATPLTFKVMDSGVPAQSASVTLTLSVDPGVLIVTTTSLPNGQVGASYTATLAAAGGTAPYTWSITSGVLPAGLTLNPNGTITGTPNGAASVTTLMFKVTDSATGTATAPLTLTIAPAILIITSTSLPNGQVGVPYSVTLAALGGTKPYTWSLTSGTLPAGLTLTPATGVISGTPTTAVSGTSLTFGVTDSGSPQQSAPAAMTLTITTGTLSITTTSLPGGTIGAAYSASLSAAGGTTPYTWSVASGTLPAGLTLDPVKGVIAGTPTAAGSSTATFKVTDAGTPQQSATATLTLTITTTGITVTAIAPKAAALTVGQTLSVSATTNDASGVTWSLNPAGGSITPTTSLTGVNVTLTAPGTAGVYTLTATSISDNTKSFAIKVAVTDLSGVFTYRNDVARDGANTQEYALTTTSTTTGTFGKLFSLHVDGAVYAQPLWAANLTVSGAKHNVLFVATQHDSVYAFDADTGTQLWKGSLVSTAYGATAGETSVPGTSVGSGYQDVVPEIGITGTPVIDSAAGILYVVAKSVDSTGTIFYQRLHAISLTTGAEKPGAPTVIAGTYPGTDDGGTTVTFSAQQEHQRPSLALVNGTIYVAWGSHEDHSPWYGWMMGYTFNGSAFTQTAILNVAPNGQPAPGESGIWMSGGAPAADPSGNLYFATGNGPFDANSSTAPNNDFGDSLVKVTPALTAPTSTAGYFTPSNEVTLNSSDLDLGAGGPVVLSLPAGAPHLVVIPGKDGYVYVLKRDNLGGFGDANAYIPPFLADGGAGQVYGTPAFWNNTLYVTGVYRVGAGGIAPLNAYTVSPTTGAFSGVTSSSPGAFWFPGVSASVSASSATANGIVWALDNSKYCTGQSPSCGPTVLHAYDATRLSTELWNSTMAGGDIAGFAVKFTVPTVANGKVYIGTRGDNYGGADSSTANPGEVDVYGLKP